jgi:hypothetical protein
MQISLMPEIETFGVFFIGFARKDPIIVQLTKSQHF